MTARQQIRVLHASEKLDYSIDKSTAMDEITDRVSKMNEADARA